MVLAVTSQLQATAQLGEVWVEQWAAGGLIKPQSGTKTNGRSTPEGYGLTSATFLAIFPYGSARYDSPAAEKRTDFASVRRKRSALFIFNARGANQPDSNIMIEFDPMAQVFVSNYSGQKGTIASLFDGPVDVVKRDGLKPTIRPATTADAIYAF